MKLAKGLNLLDELAKAIKDPEVPLSATGLLMVARTRIIALEEALQIAVDVAAEAQREWDLAPRDMRPGKLLIALAGGLPRYRPDIDKVHAVLAP